MARREIKYIVIHCSATKKNTSVSSILSYWKKVSRWKNPGYHFIIKNNGMIEQLHPLSKIANGVQNFNSNSIHISYIGGVDDNKNPADTRTKAQYLAMSGLVMALKGVYPKAEILGHRDFAGVKKECPCFEVKEFLKEITE